MTSLSGAPVGNVSDNNYMSRIGRSQILVRKGDALVEDPIDPATADSDETLGMFISRCSRRLVTA